MRRSDAFFVLNDMYSEATAEQRAAINMAMRDLEFMDLMPKDMVPVVRCKDCIHYEIHKPNILENCERKGRLIPMKPDDFCSYGERKDGDG